jgi:dynein heavy chain
LSNKLFYHDPKFNSRWSQAFKKHLTDHVVKSLSDLNNFIEKADEGLMQQVKEDDYDGLVKVMEFLKVVKEKQLTTDTMFDPLGNIIEMLRGYGVVIPEESLVQLQELPEKWGNTKRLSVQAIQQVK